MLILAGTVAVLIGFWLIAAGLYEKEKEDGEKEPQAEPEIEG